jgi:hypothetical protein
MQMKPGTPLSFNDKMVWVVENVEGTYKNITIPFNLRDKQSRLVRDANGKLCTEKREEEWLISFGFAVPDMRKVHKYVHAKKTNPDGLHTKLSNTQPGTISVISGLPSTPSNGTSTLLKNTATSSPSHNEEHP